MGAKRKNTVSDLGSSGNSASSIRSDQKTAGSSEVEINSGATIKRTRRTKSEGKQKVNGREDTSIQNTISKFVIAPTVDSNEEVVLSLDISTTSTGVVIMNSCGSKLVKLDYVKLDIAKLHNIFEKADYMDLWMKENLSGMKIKKIFVEANAKRFAPGLSSADIILTLAKMNALVSYLSHKRFGAEVVYVHVTSARSAIGYKNTLKIKKPVKEKVRKYVLEHFPDLPLQKHIAKSGHSKGKEILDTGMHDAIDAFVICLGALNLGL